MVDNKRGEYSLDKGRIALEFKALADEVIKGYEIANEEAMEILECPDEEILELLNSAYIIRKHYYGNKVKLNMIINTKSGACQENDGYCAQSRDSTNPIEKHRMMQKDENVERAERAYQLQSGTYCIVASGRGPTSRELHQLTSAVNE